MNEEQFAVRVVGGILERVPLLTDDLTYTADGREAADGPIQHQVKARPEPIRPKVETENETEKRVRFEFAEMEKPYGGDLRLKLKDREEREKLIRSAINAERTLQREWREQAEARQNLPSLEKALEESEKQLAEAMRTRDEAERVLATARSNAEKMNDILPVILKGDIIRPKVEWTNILREGY